MANKNVWIGRANAFEFGLQVKRFGESFESVGLGMVTHMRLELRQGSVVLHNVLVYRDDDSDPPLNWWKPELAEGSIEFRMGVWAEQNGVVPGRYQTRLTVYDDVYTEGIVWASFAKTDLEVTFYE